MNLPLFDPIKKARRTDPITSHMAAREAEPLASADQTAILNFLEGVSPMAASCEDIGGAIGRGKHEVGRRMKELETAGRVERAGFTILGTKRAGTLWRAK